MDFLSNLWSAVKTGASSIANSLTNAFNNVTGQSASANNALQPQPLDPTLQKFAASSAPAAPEIYQVKSTPQGDMAYGQNNSNIISFSGNQPGTTYYGAQAGDNPVYNQYNQAVRPSTASVYSAPADSQGRISTPSQGGAYIDASGKLVIPTTGFSGQAGSGGNAFTATPASGNTGAAGSGGSAHTGLLGAVGTAPSTTTTTPTDENKKKPKESQVGTVNLGPQTTGAVNSIMTSNQTALNIPKVPDVVDAGFITQMSDAVNKLASTSLSANDRQDTINLLTQNLVAAKQKLDQQTAVPDNPVVDTPDQLAFIKASQDPFGATQAIDDFKAANTDLSNLHTSQIETMKNIQALNAAYKPILDDIKNNPDLPKALSRRRIEDLATTQKQTMQGFLDQLDITNQEISNQNEIVNRAFQLVTTAQNQDEKAKDDARSNLQIMINSGAIAGFNDADINQYAAAVGIPAASLQKAKEQALNGKVDTSMVGNAESGYYSVVTDKATGKVISKTQILAGTGPSGGNTAADKANQAYAMINQLIGTRNSAGMPYTDSNGFFTVQGFKDIVQAAAESGVSRQDVIKQYADHISPYNPANYGLTPAEKTLLGFT